MTTETDYAADDRQAAKQGAAFARRFGLRKRVGKALAYKRMGYSASGVAKRLDVNESTAKGYLNDLADRFGGAALWAYHADDESDPLTGHDASEQTSNTDVSDSGSETPADPLGHVNRAGGGEVE